MKNIKYGLLMIVVTLIPTFAIIGAKVHYDKDSSELEPQSTEFHQLAH